MKKNSFIQGAMIATIGIVVSKILGIIYVIPFYEIIGQRGGALYGYAYSIYSIFLNLSSIGIPLAISRMTSEYNALEQYHLKEKTFKLGKNVILVLSLISFLILILFAPSIAYLFIGNIEGGNTIEDVTFVIRIVATALLVVPTLSVTRGYLQGHKYIAISTYSQVYEQFFRVLIIVIGSYVAVNVLHMPIKVGVGIAVFAATMGGLLAYLYLLFKMHGNKDDMHRRDITSRETVKVSNKALIIKILTYAAPFIFTSLITSFYTFVDMSTVVKTMVEGLGYAVSEAEVVLSILSTWGAKLNMIIAAIATGLVTSLIPNISSSFIKKNYPDVRSKINKSLQILLYVTVPMTLGISLLSIPIWTIFYGFDILSSNILKYSIFVALFSCVLTTLNVIMQFLNDNKGMFIYITAGLIVKIIFNIPLMHSFEEMGLHAGYGATTATILGFSTSIILILRRLHKEIDVNYEETINRLLLIIYSCLIMTLVILLLQFVLPIDNPSRLASLVIIFIYAIVGFITYLFVTIRRGLLVKIFGETFINKILVKLRIKKQ